jgi:hypothetical protein
MCGSNRVTPETEIKYILKSVVHVFGYLYIAGFINARKMEQYFCHKTNEMH